VTAQAVQIAQELSQPLQGIGLLGMDFSISAQFIGMSDIVMVMPGIVLEMGAACDGATPPRKTPSARTKTAIWRPKTRANISQTLYARSPPIKDRQDGAALERRSESAFAAIMLI